MPKYPQETKDKAVEMAKQGVHLKTIQTEIGPNPKATMRYLAKQGIDYKKLREELKAQGKEPKTLVQENKERVEKKSSKKSKSREEQEVPSLQELADEEIIEE